MTGEETDRLAERVRADLIKAGVPSSVQTHVGWVSVASALGVSELHHPGDWNAEEYITDALHAARAGFGSYPLTPDELRQRRAELGLTQAQLAERLNVAPNTVYRWEHGDMAIARPEWVRAQLDRLPETPRPEYTPSAVLPSRCPSCGMAGTFATPAATGTIEPGKDRAGVPGWVRIERFECSHCGEIAQWWTQIDPNQGTTDRRA